MTTNVITNILEPICELYYKYKRDLDLYQANINTIRSYGQSTNFSINFGFELYQPFDINNIKLQPGVYTTNSTFVAQPTISSSLNTINVQNCIVLQELPVLSTGVVTYVNKTLPLIIGLQSSPAGILGIISSYATNGIPYYYDNNINQSIIRQFESDYVSNTNFSILIFVNLQNTTFVGIQTYYWQAVETALYSIEVQSYRYNNGFGQFYSYPANIAFIPNNLSVSQTTLEQLYTNTYGLVNNWMNNLTWVPTFGVWFSLNKMSLTFFLKKFLAEHFNLS